MASRRFPAPWVVTEHAECFTANKWSHSPWRSAPCKALAFAPPRSPRRMPCGSFMRIKTQPRSGSPNEGPGGTSQDHQHDPKCCPSGFSQMQHRRELTVVHGALPRSTDHSQRGGRRLKSPPRLPSPPAGGRATGGLCHRRHSGPPRQAEVEGPRVPGRRARHRRSLDCY